MDSKEQPISPQEKSRDFIFEDFDFIAANWLFEENGDFEEKTIEAGRLVTQVFGDTLTKYMLEGTDDDLRTKGMRLRAVAEAVAYFKSEEEHDDIIRAWCIGYVPEFEDEMSVAEYVQGLSAEDVTHFGFASIMYSAQRVVHNEFA